MDIFLIFICGLFIGSFLNVVIDRLPRNETFLTGRSHCDICKHSLSLLDLLPVISFLMLSGKCRYCKKNIGWKYPIIEITTAVFFSATFIFLPQSNLQNLSLPYYLFIVSFLIVIFFTDLRYGIIPDLIILLLGLTAMINVVFFERYNLENAILSSFVAGGFFFLLYFFTKGKGMGFGDVKLAFVMGIFSFPKVIVSMYVAFLTATAASLILILLGRKKFHNQTIPFGPFLAIGIYIALFLGDIIWKKYIGIFM